MTERNYQLSLLLRSVYLRGQADENSQQTNMDWEDNIISQINQLFSEGKDLDIKKLDCSKLAVCEYGNTNMVIGHIFTLAKKINEIIDFIERKR